MCCGKYNLDTLIYFTALLLLKRVMWHTIEQWTLVLTDGHFQWTYIFLYIDHIQFMEFEHDSGKSWKLNKLCFKFPERLKAHSSSWTTRCTNGHLIYSDMLWFNWCCNFLLLEVFVMYSCHKWLFHFLYYCHIHTFVFAHSVSDLLCEQASVM